MNCAIGARTIRRQQRRAMTTTILFLLYSFLAVLKISCIEGFATGAKQPEQLQRRTKNSQLNYAFQQLPDESDMDFMKRINQMASDPDTFAAAVLSGDTCAQEGKGAQEGKEQPEKKKVAAYERVEDWDAEEKAKRKKGNMTWEEKVKFDGQRHGNQDKQNSILMDNLYK